jgi:hypothetical protein
VPDADVVPIDGYFSARRRVDAPGQLSRVDLPLPDRPASKILAFFDSERCIAKRLHLLFTRRIDFRNVIKLDEAHLRFFFTKT